MHEPVTINNRNIDAREVFFILWEQIYYTNSTKFDKKNRRKIRNWHEWK